MNEHEWVVIHTDGACRGNPGPGGWGALLEYRGKTKELNGSMPDTTNNRMELTAAVEALRSLKRSCRIKLYTDSTYVKQGLGEWMPRWKRNGWKTSAKKPVRNQDLWQALDAEAARHEIEWHWVKGHSGDPGNERADQLANLAIDEMEAA
ncbi:MAG: ribonuclease HI [marine bacterium B5-7]|nr:MAG: ribonuclease HI [marine bacterium B5-7]